MPLDESRCILCSKQQSNAWGVWEGACFYFDKEKVEQAAGSGLKPLWFSFEDSKNCKVVVPAGCSLGLFQSDFSECILKQDACLFHQSLGCDCEQTFVLESGAQLTHCRQDFYRPFNGVSSVHVLLKEPGARVDWQEGYWLESNTHAKVQLRVVHQAPKTYSRCSLKSVLKDQAQGSFRIDTTIEKAATQSQADQHILNYVLSKTARVVNQPQLHIYNKHVQANHGCATQPLPENVLLYMQTRGIPFVEAQRLFLDSFLKTTHEAMNCYV